MSPINRWQKHRTTIKTAAIKCDGRVEVKISYLRPCQISHLIFLHAFAKQNRKDGKYLNFKT